MKYLKLLLLVLVVTSCSSVQTVDPFTQGCKNAPNEAMVFFNASANQNLIEQYLNGAISCDRLDTVRYMADNKIININGNNGGKTIPLTFAAARNKKDITNYILSHPDFNPSINSQVNKALMGAIYTDAAMLELLLQNGGDVNYQEDGNSVVQQHIFYGEIETVKFLVENGADIKKEDRNLVAHALTQSKEQTAIYLIELGFDFTGVQSQGWTPIKLAANKDMVDIVTLMLSKLPNNEAKLSLINETINTVRLRPKMKAALQTQKEIVLARL